MTDAQTITRALGGKWYGRYGRVCCPACNGNNKQNPSLSVRLGTNGALLLWCFKGCEFSEILSCLRGLGLVTGGGTYSPPSPNDLSSHKAELNAKGIMRAAQAERCWQEAVPIAGTFAETYLRGRGITCVLPNTLRFHPECWHGSAKRLPAIIARVDGAERFAIHRTYLQGSRKADVAPNKAMLGSVKGGAVRLAEGPGPLAVAEGIETALSLASGLVNPCGSAWAALSSSGMYGLNLPETLGDLVIASDGDAAGRSAAFNLAERAAGLGWRVSTIDPGDGLDFNDVLLREVAA